MQTAFFRWILPLACAATLAAQATLPDVQERVLKNGMRVLQVERPGTRAVHARLFLRGGSADTGRLTPLAAELLVRNLSAPVQSAPWAELEPLLKQEEGAFEALRVARLQPTRQGNPEIQELETLHHQAFLRIQELAEQAGLQDPAARLGAVNGAARAEADYLTWGVDLPAESLRAWCLLQAEQLRQPRLPWFPLERQRLLQRLEREPDADRDALSILLGTALIGRAYSQAFSAQRSGLEALTWSETLAYARRGISPERLVLVLVGNLRPVLEDKDLEGSFGALPVDMEGLRGDVPGDLPEAPGARRLQASTPRGRRLFMAWRVPPRSHPDTPMLQVLAQILAGGRQSRLVRTLVAEKRIAQSITARTSVPGGRQPGLLLIDAEPGADHALGELEQAIQGLMMRVQQEPVTGEEIRRAQRGLEAELLMAQEDAASLANTLGTAQCEGGDWRLAFRALKVARDYTPEEIRDIARRYLVPTQSITALLEPDPILNPQDRQEARLVSVLTRMLASRNLDPAQIETVIRESLRQIRMLTAPDQEKTLKLLETLVKP